MTEIGIVTLIHSVSPDTTVVVLGYDYGTVGDQSSRTVTFTYEFRAAPPAPDPYLCYKTRVKSKNEISLADRFGVRLIGVERPGTGASTPHRLRRIVDFADDIAALAERFGLRRFAAVLGDCAGGEREHHQDRHRPTHGPAA